MDDLERSEYIRKIEKESLLLKRKLERSEAQREQIEQLMDQTLLLLKRVTDEKLSEEERKRLEVFRKFVPVDFLVSLGKERFEDIQLGDYLEREMTILFSDIRNFTAISERKTPKETFDFINNYLAYLEPPIHENKGFIDKFIGDAIMALFYSTEDAVSAGVRMRQALNEYNKELADPIEFGLGIHTGLCMMGIIGGEGRLEGTVISDAVNLAARLENLTKRYQSSLLISEASFSKIKEKHKYETRFLGKVKVAGKSEIIEVLEILDAENDNIREQKYKSKTYLELGLQFYFDRKFNEARSQFNLALNEYPEDAVSKIYLAKSVAYSIEGVPEDWQGIDIVEKGE